MPSPSTTTPLELVAPEPAPAPARAPTARIAVLIETSTSWGIELVRGVGEYARTHGDWHILQSPLGRYERAAVPFDAQPDGVIARVNTPALAAQLNASGIPTVNVSWYDNHGPRMTRVTSDERAIGRAAATHLIERGLRQLCMVPPSDRPGYKALMHASFNDRARELGATLLPFLDADAFARAANQADRVELLATWVAGLPRPVGLAGFSGLHAREIIDACRLASVAVPQEVAVVAGEHDELSSLISLPQISSVPVMGYTVGYQAAATLHRMLRSGGHAEASRFVPPVGIIQRESTDVLAVDDHDVRKACMIMRERFAEPIGVEYILDHVCISRRTLERKFLAAFGCSPAVVLRRIRIERAAQLLHDSNLGLASIARRTGFRQTTSLVRAFRANYHGTPGEVRKSMRHHTLPNG